MHGLGLDWTLYLSYFLFEFLIVSFKKGNPINKWLNSELYLFLDSQLHDMIKLKWIKFKNNEVIRNPNIYHYFEEKINIL